MTLEKYYEWLMPDNKKLNLRWNKPQKYFQPKRFLEFRYRLYRLQEMPASHTYEWDYGQYIGMEEDGYLEIGYIHNGYIENNQIAKLDFNNLRKFGQQKYKNRLDAIRCLFANKKKNGIYFAFHPIPKNYNEDSNYSFFKNEITWFDKRGRHQTLCVKNK